MSEPLTKAEMIANWQAARGRLAAAGLKQIAIEVERQRETEQRQREAEQQQAAEAARRRERRARGSSRVKARLIIEAAEMLCGPSVLSPSHRKIHSRWRQAAMFLIDKHTSLSMYEIGKLFGGRDHTTAMYSVRVGETRHEEIAAIEALTVGGT